MFFFPDAPFEQFLEIKIFFEIQFHTDFHFNLHPFITFLNLYNLTVDYLLCPSTMFDYS